MKRTAIALLTLVTAIQEPSRSGLLEGIVTQTETGQPIANVVVSLEGGPADPAALAEVLGFFAGRGIAPNFGEIVPTEEDVVRILTEAASARGLNAASLAVASAIERFRTTSNAGLKAISDAAGRFVIRDVVPGDYVLAAAHERFFRDVLRGSTVSVAAGQGAGIALTMTTGGTVSGKVTDARGNAVRNATVTAYTLAYPDGVPELRSGVSRKTDDRGAYRLFWLPEGEYWIGVLPPATGLAQVRPVRAFFPGTVDVSRSTTVMVRAGNETSRVDIAVPEWETFAVSGQVRSSSATVRSQEGGPPSVGQRGMPGQRGAGQGRGSGAARATISLVLQDADRPHQPGTGASVNVLLQPFGDEYSGEFEIRGVLPGSYYLRAAIGTAAGIVPIEVRNHDVTGVSVDLLPAVRVNER